MKISVLESGAWGTALAVTLTDNGHEVTLHSVYGRRSAEMRESGENKYLPGVKLPESLLLCDGADISPDTEMIFFVTPSFSLRQTLSGMRGKIPDAAVLVSASKGIESGTLLRLSQVIEEELDVASSRIAAISGPSHAEEVGRRIPTGLVAACVDHNTARAVQGALMNPNLRVYTSRDIVGVEFCGALKNVIALCAGICDGLGLGDNTIAMLMTRGLAEISEMGYLLGGRKETFAGLAGVGDLIVTCTSKHSRNRRAGLYIGQGMTPEAAMEKVGATVEGYYAAKAANELAEKTGAEMPISREVYRVLYEGKAPGLVLNELMTRDRKSEHGELFL
jgi:glycerol-3-phosphate dehydrogenase (NAD(P)+)